MDFAVAARGHVSSRVDGEPSGSDPGVCRRGCRRPRLHRDLPVVEGTLSPSSIPAGTACASELPASRGPGDLDTVICGVAGEAALRG